MTARPMKIPAKVINKIGRDRVAESGQTLTSSALTGFVATTVRAVAEQLKERCAALIAFGRDFLSIVVVNASNNEDDSAKGRTSGPDGGLSCNLKRLGLKADEPKPIFSANQRPRIVPAYKSSAKRLAPGRHMHLFVPVSSRPIRLHWAYPTHSFKGPSRIRHFLGCLKMTIHM